jgi:ABC-2 type transport system ATP-binding protein
VAIIDRGKLLALGTIEELKASVGRSQVTRIEGVISSKAVAAIRKLPEVEQASRTSLETVDILTVVTRNGHESLPQMIETLSQSGALIQKIAPEEVTLEDVFVAKTGRTLAEDTWAR